MVAVLSAYSLTDKINLIRIYIQNGKTVEEISNATRITQREILLILEKYLRS